MHVLSMGAFAFVLFISSLFSGAQFSTSLKQLFVDGTGLNASGTTPIHLYLYIFVLLFVVISYVFYYILLFESVCIFYPLVLLFCISMNAHIEFCFNLFIFRVLISFLFVDQNRNFRTVEFLSCAHAGICENGFIS